MSLLGRFREQTVIDTPKPNVSMLSVFICPTLTDTDRQILKQHRLSEDQFRELCVDIIENHQSEDHILTASEVGSVWACRIRMEAIDDVLKIMVNHGVLSAVDEGETFRAHVFQSSLRP